MEKQADVLNQISKDASWTRLLEPIFVLVRTALGSSKNLGEGLPMIHSLVNGTMVDGVITGVLQEGGGDVLLQPVDEDSRAAIDLHDELKNYSYSSDSQGTRWGDDWLINKTKKTLQDHPSVIHIREDYGLAINEEDGDIPLFSAFLMLGSLPYDVIKILFAATPSNLLSENDMKSLRLWFDFDDEFSSSNLDYFKDLLFGDWSDADITRLESLRSKLSGIIWSNSSSNSSSTPPPIYRSTDCKRRRATNIAQRACLLILESWTATTTTTTTKDEAFRRLLLSSGSLINLFVDEKNNNPDGNSLGLEVALYILDMGLACEESSSSIRNNLLDIVRNIFELATTTTTTTTTTPSNKFQLFPNIFELAKTSTATTEVATTIIPSNKLQHHCEHLELTILPILRRLINICPEIGMIQEKGMGRTLLHWIGEITSLPKQGSERWESLPMDWKPDHSTQERLVRRDNNRRARLIRRDNQNELVMSNHRRFVEDYIRLCPAVLKITDKNKNLPLHSFCSGFSNGEVKEVYLFCIANAILVLVEACPATVVEENARGKVPVEEAYEGYQQYFPPSLFVLIPKQNPRFLARFYNFLLEEYGMKFRIVVKEFVKKDPVRFLQDEAVDPITGDNLLHIVWKGRTGKRLNKVQWFLLDLYCDLDTTRGLGDERSDCAWNLLRSLAATANNCGSFPFHCAMEAVENFDDKNEVFTSLDMMESISPADVLASPFKDKKEYPLHRILRSNRFWSGFAYAYEDDDMDIFGDAHDKWLSIIKPQMSIPDRHGVFPFLRAAMEPELSLTMLFTFIQLNPAIMLSSMNLEKLLASGTKR